MHLNLKNELSLEMKFFAAFLALAGVSSTLSVEVVGSLRGNYDSVAVAAATAAVAVSDTDQVQASGYASESSFEEKKNKADKAQQKLWYWTECEGCEECEYWKEMMKEATSGLKKKNAKKHFEEAKAATLRAAAHLSAEGKAAWEAFQEEHGAAAAESMADKWMKRHASSAMHQATTKTHLMILILMLFLTHLHLEIGMILYPTTMVAICRAAISVARSKM